ncbi:hypothetical protein G6F46_003428 [Rhizopus delemar]|nr:hypothetical protein G6F55_000872 [Rhizopus delemar]KAG1548580.1 hypothetical protein G6F51_003576 [Rhizopus arrhizus]KAG1501704.1 hypothetical protein G6F54_002859 [Rhizopus delemar]KAG1507146.1 hypothetical protein G6F53_009167 [Rhizopus delemar]KAG1523714.1 hypothetical protein G6F52_004796 [Rhizopus delemar]
MNFSPTLNADSFQFKRKYAEPSRRQRNTLTSMSKKKRLSQSKENIETELRSAFTIDNVVKIKGICSSALMKDHVLYIDKSIVHRKLLTQIAVAMGAQVKETMDKSSVTDLIHGPKKIGNGNPKIINEAMKKGIRRTSPLWIETCYKEHRYFSPALFPYDIDDRRDRMNWKQNKEEDVDPFGVEGQIPEDDENFGRQMGIEKYFTRMTTNSSEPVVEEEQKVEDEQEEAEKTEEKQAEEEKRKIESEIRSKLIEEAVKARKEEIEANKAKDTSDKTPLQKKKKKSVPNAPTDFWYHEGMKLWYGEQSYKL